MGIFLPADVDFDVDVDVGAFCLEEKGGCDFGGGEGDFRREVTEIFRRWMSFLMSIRLVR
jgi:hypothetical protein